MMNPVEKWFGLLFFAWAVLLVVTAVIQSDRVKRQACLLGVVGLAISFANLFVAPGALHWLLRIGAWAVLGGALYQFLNPRRQEDQKLR